VENLVAEISAIVFSATSFIDGGLDQSQAASMIRKRREGCILGRTYIRNPNQASPHPYQRQILRPGSRLPLINREAMPTPRMTRKQIQAKAR
jgi:hypothetical protein